MAILEFGKLAKLKIKSDQGEVFEVMFNPESYSERFAVEYRKRQTANSGVEEFDFVKSIPQDFQLKLIIDGTGVSDYNVTYLPVFKKTDESVSTQVDRFLNLAWYPKNGYPNALTISWGNFSFSCRLKDVNIKYTLFSREGLPLRAELDASFIGDPQKNKKNYERRFGSMLTSSGSASTTSTSSATAKGQNGIVISVS